MQTFEGWIASLQVFSVQNKIRRSLLYNFAYHLKSNGRPWLLQTFFTLLEKVKKKKITEACTQFKEKIDDKIQMYQKTMSFPVNNY